MDLLTFEKSFEKYKDKEGEYLTVRILINGKPLLDIARDYEQPYAKRNNRDDLAGSYSVDPIYLYRYLTDPRLRSAGSYKFPALVCECGCEGCYDLEATFIEKDNEIIWSDFHNRLHSTPTSPIGYYDYSDFPVFHFNKQQYEQALTVFADIRSLIFQNLNINTEH